MTELNKINLKNKNIHEIKGFIQKQIHYGSLEHFKYSIKNK